MLQLTREQQSKINRLATLAYPQECCGLLLGQTPDQMPDQIDGSQDRSGPARKVTLVWPTDNAWTPEVEAEFHKSLGGLSATPMSEEHSQRDRFWIDPLDLLKAQKFARSQSWNIVGIYHSHPNHAAIPSERDRLSAWTAYSYLILSVLPGEETVESEAGTAIVADCQSWSLDAERQFQPENVEILP